MPALLISTLSCEYRSRNASAKARTDTESLRSSKMISSEADGTRSFTDLVTATDDEVIVLGWVEFESRAARDLANSKVAVDPRMMDLMNSSNSGFDAERMAYGGFLPLVQ